jgi:hypothetical protein
MLTELAASHATMNTAANPACLWLFPGRTRRPAPCPGALVQQLRAPGAPAAQTRAAACRQLVLQVPAPVVARALGYSPGTATCHVVVAGGTWHATRPPAPGAGRGTRPARQHAGSDSLSGAPGTTDPRTLRTRQLT